MTKAEQRALEAYPVKMTPLVYQDLIDQFGGKTEIDVNTYPRCLFQQGYEKAEKDIALTWGDVQLLDFYAMECQVEESKGRKFNSSQEFFEEVLRRFNKAKEEQ